jgi:hypothetical protein
MQSDLTHVAMIVDHSGSMFDHQHATCSAVNELIESQKKEPGRMTMDLVLFNQDVEIVYRDRPIENFEPLVPGTNYVCYGMTALRDAVGSQIDNLGMRLAALPEDDRPGKVLFVIQTDGLENASREYEHEQIIKMRLHQEREYQWAFLFMGADQDAWENSLGVSRGSTISYDSSDPAVAFAAAGETVSAYRKGTRSAVNLTDSKKGIDTRKNKS